MLVWSIWKIFIIRIYNIYILITFIFFQLHTNTMGYYMISGQTKNERYHIIDQVSVNNQTRNPDLPTFVLVFTPPYHMLCYSMAYVPVFLRRQLYLKESTLLLLHKSITFWEHWWQIFRPNLSSYHTAYS